MDDDLVLTAAHCGGLLDGTLVVAGSIEEYLKKYKTLQIRSVKSKCFHPAASYHQLENIQIGPRYALNEIFTNLDIHHDIMSVKMNQSFTFNDYVQPICLAMDDEPVPKDAPSSNEIYIQPGFGLTNNTNIDHRSNCNKMNITVVKPAPEEFDYVESYDKSAKNLEIGQKGSHEYGPNIEESLLLSNVLKYNTLRDSKVSDRYLRQIDIDRANIRMDPMNSQGFHRGESGSPIVYERIINGEVRHFLAGIVSNASPCPDLDRCEGKKFRSDIQLQSTIIRQMLKNHNQCAEKYEGFFDNDLIFKGDYMYVRKIV